MVVVVRLPHYARAAHATHLPLKKLLCASVCVGVSICVRARACVYLRAAYEYACASARHCCGWHLGTPRALSLPQAVLTPPVSPDRTTPCGTLPMCPRACVRDTPELPTSISRLTLSDGGCRLPYLSGRPCRRAWAGRRRVRFKCAVVRIVPRQAPAPQPCVPLRTRQHSNLRAVHAVSRWRWLLLPPQGRHMGPSP